MTVVNNGLYRLDLKQLYSDQEILNTFWYWDNQNNNDRPSLLASLFNTAVLPTIAPIQHTSTVYSEIKVTPIFGTAVEAVLTPTTINGTLVGTKLASFMAVSMRLNRGSRELRNGWKRFAGLVEEETNANSFNGPYITLCQTAATNLQTSLLSGGVQFDPVIVRKPFSTKAQSPNWEMVDVDSITVLNRPTSQNTRKGF